MCYVGRPSKCEAGSQKCCKDLANTRLDLRNAANSLQIEGKRVLPGDPYHWEHGTRDHIYIYIHTHCICVYIYMYTVYLVSVSMFIYIYIYTFCICIYIYTVYIYIYVCMYVHICSRSYTKRETERRRRRRKRRRRRREVPFQVGKKPAKIPMSDGKTTRCP